MNNTRLNKRWDLHWGNMYNFGMDYLDERYDQILDRKEQIPIEQIVRESMYREDD
jgi:hypothetical protein